MFSLDDLVNLRSVFSNAKTSSFLILLKSQPTYDQVASALALLLALQSQKMKVQLVCSQPMTVEFGNLVGVDQIMNSLGNRNLQVSFDYSEEMVENVSYNIDHEHKKFHLVIRPHKGHRSLDPTTIEYSHTGLDADVIFLIGIGNFSEIPEYYQSEEQAFHQAHTVALNKFQTTFANTNLDGTGFSSFSEMIYSMLKNLQLEIQGDVATNLFAGLEQATEGFRHYAVNADTFKLAADLMEAGARRIKSGGTTQPSASTSSLAQAFAKKTSSQPVPATDVQPAQSGQVEETLGVPQLQRMQMPSDYSPPRR